MNRSESLTKLAPALLKAQKKMGVALKDSKNPFYKSKYADLNAVIDASVPVLNEEGIAVLQNVNMELAGTSVETVLLHESGEYISSSTPIIVAKANDPQSAGSAISYARRYGLQSMTVLKAEDDDGNLGSGKTTKAETTTETKSVAASGGTATLDTTTSPVSNTETPKKKVSFSKKAATAATKTVTTESDL